MRRPARRSPTWPPAPRRPSCRSASRSPISVSTPRPGAACVQLHGGIGVTWEHDLHLFLRRVTLYRSMFGTPEEHNLRVYRHRGGSSDRDDVGTDRAPTETVAEFAARARAWLADNMPHIDPARPPAAAVARRPRGCGPANCSGSCTPVGSRASASPASTAGSDCPSPTRRPSTRNRATTSCRSS